LQGEEYEIRITASLGRIPRALDPRSRLPGCADATPGGGICGIAEDVTERKMAEADVVEANRRLRELSRRAGMAEVATSVLHT